MTEAPMARLTRNGRGECREVPEDKSSTPSGVVGLVELAEGVPAAQAKVRVTGFPASAKCDADGAFAIWGLPPGGWTLRAEHPLAAGQTKVRVGVAQGVTTQTGSIRLRATGSIRGRVVLLDPDDLATAVVTVPEQGIATQPNLDGGYLLNGVAAGDREIVLLHGRYSGAPQRKATVKVTALKVAEGPNFIRSTPYGSPALLDFGTTFANATPQLAWKLNNPDDTAALVQAVTITGADAGKFHLVNLPPLPCSVPGSGLELKLGLDASSLGTFAAELRVQGEAETVPFTEVVALKALVAPPPFVPSVPDVRIDPIELDFGQMPGPDTRPIQLVNDGNTNATFYLVPSPGPFQLLTPPSFPLSVPAHSSQTVTVRATPPGPLGPVTSLLNFVAQPGQRSLQLKATAVWQ